MSAILDQVNLLEITTLQDNYVDILSQDNTEVVKRALPVENGKLKNSILAEHGFSAIIKVQNENGSHAILFDFGFSEHGAAFNANTLKINLSDIEAMVLSHGHPDHYGGYKQLIDNIGKKEINFYVHPAAFRNPRYNKTVDGKKVYFPTFTREKIESTGVRVVEKETSCPFCDNSILFLGEIPQITPFEKGAPSFCFEDNGIEIMDGIEDDTGIAINIKEKGLAVITGCAHSGIINTIKHAQKITGTDKVFAVMGGFHLSGAFFEPLIQPTIDALKTINPTYIIPTHCTGRKAIHAMEREMPEKFILNMSGTSLTFTAYKI